MIENDPEFSRFWLKMSFLMPYRVILAPKLTILIENGQFRYQKIIYDRNDQEFSQFRWEMPFLMLLEVILAPKIDYFDRKFDRKGETARGKFSQILANISCQPYI